MKLVLDYATKLRGLFYREVAVVLQCSNERGKVHYLTFANTSCLIGLIGGCGAVKALRSPDVDIEILLSVDKRLEVKGETYVDLAAGKVVGHCVLYVVDIGNPVIGTYVGYVEEIEHVYAEPDTLEVAQESATRFSLGKRSEEAVCESYVDAFVGRGTEVALVAR